MTDFLFLKEALSAFCLPAIGITSSIHPASQLIEHSLCARHSFKKYLLGTYYVSYINFFWGEAFIHLTSIC